MAEDDKKDAENTPGVKKKRSIFHRTVNVFLYIALGLLVLLLIAAGISQTSAFRSYARDTIIEIVNESINGKLYFEKLEGTILTSVVIRNASLTLDSDTLFKASVIEVKTSPLQLLLKKIYIRKIEITDAKIGLIVEENGRLNIDRLVPPSPEDTTSSEFPFKINVSDLSLQNVSFALQRYDIKGSTRNYESLFMDDFRVDDLNVSLSAFADIKNNDYEIDINNISLNTNLNLFALETLSGEIKANREGINAENLRIKTKNSDLEISAGLSDFNIFDASADISHALISAEVTADKFNFDDLKTFLPSVDIFDYPVFVYAKFEGSLKELEISKINAEYLSTQINLTGKITDVDNPDRMFITADLDGSYAKVEDINVLMPFLDLPLDYNRAGTIKFDTLRYAGSIYEFRSSFYARTEVGNIQSVNFFNYGGADLVYDVGLQTYNFNASPFTGIESNINSKAGIRGSGTSPASLNTVVNFEANGSVIGGNRFSELQLKTNAQNSIINYSLQALKDSSEIQLTGSFDFSDENNPTYQFNGTGTHLNVSDFTGNSALVTDLNFTADAEGKGFDAEKMNLLLNLNLFDSDVNGSHVDSTRAIVDLRMEESGERVINVISDLADITVTGNFSLNKSLSLIENEAGLLTRIVNEKLDEIMPAEEKAVTEKLSISKESSLDPEDTGVAESLRIKYLVDLKDFNLISVLLGQNQLEIKGEMSGTLIYTGDSIKSDFRIVLEYLKYKTPESAMFLSGLDLDFTLNNSLNAESFYDISSGLNLKIDRVFAGADIKDISLNLELTRNTSHFMLNGNYNDKVYANIGGGLTFAGGNVNLLLDKLKLKYNELELLNRKKINISYADERVSFTDFVLSRNGSDISIKGDLSGSGSQDLMISVNNLSVADLLKNAFNSATKDNINAKLNISTHITGNMGSPAIAMNMTVDSVSYRGKTFGSLITELNYRDRNAFLKTRFEEINSTKKVLEIDGNYPVDLSMGGSENRGAGNDSINISLIADNFDLAAFGDLLPQVDRLSGSFSAKLDINGTKDDLQKEGYLAVRNVSFISEANNLIYNAGLRVDIHGNDIMIDTILVQNGPDVPDGGTISGNGKAVIDGFDVKSGVISVGGRLKLLSKNSRSSAAPVYGNLVITTRQNIEFRVDGASMFLKAPIIVKHADLTIPPSPGAYQNTNRSFVYKFVKDSLNSASDKLDFESLIAYNEQLSADNAPAEKQSNFNYSVSLEVEDEAKIVFVLSREINQNLTAVLTGNVLYENVRGAADIQGELKLLEGSTLEFIKTFNARGSIRFESDISNPYLNITASYLNYYSPADSTEGLNEVLVGVKIKINGPLNDLNKTFVKEENNIAVYYGSENIDKDEPDPTKDASDAIMFIITGRFANDLNQREKTAATDQFSGAATSIAGSVLGGILNQYFGEYVSGVELRRVGSETRFVFSGRAGSFRYQLGGSGNVFQNISQANLKIEYPVYKGLSLRFERREDVRERSVINEMVNELGLRYRFEF